eukprot:Gregarina_sp_Poly_1__3604@NODE_205_length_11479_cov_138_250613_g183_i0_p5_GENE_NODE_205_length_11479_cov_138_250613_g183_i0NODE_205_length_11479_cov_138_250613_g183_i0_p5_ORF_typecomplete_len446_score68_20TLD/PF07534_16/7_6e24MMS19_C/PF12460_8/0_13_NODE_205_length_11479_cov_138_250613_g183_i069458282
MGNSKSSPAIKQSPVSILQALSSDYQSPQETIKQGLFPNDPHFLGAITVSIFNYFVTHQPSSRQRKQLESFEQWLLSLDASSLITILWTAVREAIPRDTKVESFWDLLSYMYKLSIQTNTFNSVFQSNGFHIDLENRYKELESNKQLECFFDDALPCLLARDIGLSVIFKYLLTTPVGERRPKDNVIINSRVFDDEELFLLANSDLVAHPVLSRVSPILLFSIASFGQSWVRFVEKVDQYPAPILVGIKTKEGNILGAYIDGGLRESATKYFGTSQTFLFSLMPKYFLCRASGNSDNYIMMNLKSTYVTPGLGFGGDEQNHRLLVSADLRTLIVTYSDKTFKPGELIDLKDQDGSLMFRKEAEIEELELWGFGSDKDLKLQRRAKEREEDVSSFRSICCGGTPIRVSLLPIRAQSSPVRSCSSHKLSAPQEHRYGQTLAPWTEAN